MVIILHDTFPFEGPFGDDMTEGFKSIAESINKEEGFIRKIWTENRQTEEAGGTYAFDNLVNA